MWYKSDQEVRRVEADWNTEITHIKYYRAKNKLITFEQLCTNYLLYIYKQANGKKEAFLNVELNYLSS